MPKKIDLRASLRQLGRLKPDTLRPVSARISARCLMRLLERCVREKQDLAVVVRQTLEDYAESEPGRMTAPEPLPEEAKPWLDAAIQRVRQAYHEGVSPVDAVIQLPLWHDPLGNPYKGPLAPLITAAIQAIPIQEILDYRTLEVIEQQKERKHETFAQRLWREALEKAPRHVLPHAEKLKRLELELHARVKLAWRPEDEESATPPVVWWFDGWVMQELAKPEPQDDVIQSVQRLVRAGFLCQTGPNEPNTFRWEEE